MHILLDELIATPVETNAGFENAPEVQEEHFEPEYDMDDLSLFLSDFADGELDNIVDVKELRSELGAQDEEEELVEEDSDEEAVDEQVAQEEVEDDEDYDEEVIEIGEDAMIPIGDTEVSFADLKAAYKTKEEIEGHINIAKNEYEKAVAAKKDMEDALMLSKLEAEVELETYAGMTQADWREMARTRPEDYAEHKEYFDRMMNKRNLVENHLREMNEEKAAREAEAQQAQVQESIKFLREKIPGFNRELADEIISHAVNDLGAPESIADTTDPFTILAMYNSLKMHKGIREAATKIRRKVASTPISQKRARVTSAPASAEVPKSFKYNGQSYTDADLALFMN